MLTKEQKWMNRLERCLKDMPKGCELLVTLDYASVSTFCLLEEGEIAKHDHFMFLNIDASKERAKSFSLDRVIACSENI